MFLNSLSGRFLTLTIIFVMLAEVMIYVPSVARFREDYLLLRLERAQIASLALLADDMIDPELEAELLKNAGVYNVVLRRNEVRQLILSSPIPEQVEHTYDLRTATPMSLIMDAIATLFDTESRVIRVVGEPVKGAGSLIEVTMATAPLRQEMLDYGLRIFLLSAVISIITASLLFIAVRRFLVRPIKGVVGAMKSYSDAPEDSRRIIEPSAGIVELREAEEALKTMQTQLTAALRQKERLAQLGSAVAKVNHDLRNILTTAQLFTDRIEASSDPAVQRTVPKLINSITRAVNLCETTLAFGKAEEPPPLLNRFPLFPLVDDLLDSERLASEGENVSFNADIAKGLMIRADSDQLFRVISNLVRNARQAIVTSGKPGRITVAASENDEDWTITISDTGPGLPAKARDHLFQAFQGGARADGFGLGLAIAAELVRGHGGRLDLQKSDSTGTTFAIRLPRNIEAVGIAAS
jgi:signal transduction histidine kinase